MIFTGSVIVVPDASGLARAGESTVGGKASGRGAASELGGVQVENFTYAFIYFPERASQYISDFSRA